MKFIVSLNMPDDVTAAEACEYLQTAIVGYGGCLDPESPFFHLLRSDVEVKDTKSAVDEALDRVISSQVKGRDAAAAVQDASEEGQPAPQGQRGGRR